MARSTIAGSFRLATAGAVLAVASVVGMPQAEAATVFTDESSFLFNLEPDSYLETFDASEDVFVLPASLPFSGSGFSYTVTARNGALTLPRNPMDDQDYWLSADPENDSSLVLEFTSGNISAVGGNFFSTGFSPASDDTQLGLGNILLTLSDGTTRSLTNPTNTTFIGFTADPGSVFTSLIVSAPAGGASDSLYATLNNLRVGRAVPIPTPALLPGLLGIGFATLRQRQPAKQGLWRLLRHR